MIKKQLFPSTTGIYIFKDKNTVLYVGKSVNIKARIASHIENAKQDPKENQIVSLSDHIEYIVTESEFKALLLESSLIQKYHPKYNVIWKDDKSYLYIKINIKDQYPKIRVVRKENDHASLYFGPFSSSRSCALLLREIRRIIPYCTQRNISKTPCFYSKINLCNPCPNDIEKKNDTTKKNLRKVYKNNIRSIIRILRGKTEPVLHLLYLQLKQLSIKTQYEEAIKIRNKIFRLENLLYRKSFQSDLDPFSYNQSEKSLQILLDNLRKYFPRLNSLERIECYDISNINQKNATASMVVIKNGLSDKSQYRRFKIKSKTSRSDFEMLDEIITRRFRNHWDIPNIVVVDGGKPQVRQVMKTLAQNSIAIPVIGIAKNPDRIVVGNNTYSIIRFIHLDQGYNLIRYIRDESHRFARKYHLLLREKDFLI